MPGINYIMPQGNKLYNHNFSHDNVLSGQIGKLIPIQCDEVLPKERWRENVSFLMRFAPLTYPAMVKMNVCFYSFYVPTRIITPRNSAQSTWEKFILSLGETSDNIPELPCIFTSDALTKEQYTESIAMLKKYFAIGGLSDYLDLIGVAKTELEIEQDNLFHIPYEFRVRLDGLLCYLYIYNYWFRRDQIEPEIKMPLSLGAVDLSNLSNSEYVHNEDWNPNVDTDFFNWLDELFKLRDKNYERDYFTSSLPEPQYGEDVVLGRDSLYFSNLPNGFLPISNGRVNLAAGGLGSGSTLYGFLQSQASPGNTQGLEKLSAYRVAPLENGVYGFTGTPLKTDFSLSPVEGAEPSININDIFQNVSGGVSITINQLRLAMQTQAVREAINRGGTMYVEIMQNVYDSLVPDARLQQPQYLGGIKCPVQIGTVVQTSSSTAETPLGALAGKAQSANGGMLFRSKKAFAEHGYVMTIACVAPRTGYTGGIPRKWMKRDPLEYYNKYFAHLGEQEVYKGELHNDPFSGYEGQRGVFGYQERYHEYRHAYSRAHGAMRTTPKDAWHIYRQFDELPSLSLDFIKMRETDFDRIFEFENIEGTSNEHFDLIVALDIKKKSPVPKYGTPYNFI